MDALRIERYDDPPIVLARPGAKTFDALRSPSWRRLSSTWARLGQSFSSARARASVVPTSIDAAVGLAHSRRERRRRQCVALVSTRSIPVPRRLSPSSRGMRSAAGRASSRLPTSPRPRASRLRVLRVKLDHPRRISPYALQDRRERGPALPCRRAPMPRPPSASGSSRVVPISMRLWRRSRRLRTAGPRAARQPSASCSTGPTGRRQPGGSPSGGRATRARPG